MTLGRLLATAGLVVITVVGIMPTTVQSAARSLTIRVDASASVGQPIAVRITGARSGDVVILLAVGSLGTTTLTETANGDAQQFSLPVSFSRIAGQATIVARDGDAVATARITLTPGPVVGPVQTAIGARTIVANGTDRSMVVTIPVDRWGNAVASGSVVRFVRQDVDGSTEFSEVQSGDLIAWHEFTSGTSAGRDLVWATAGGSAGEPNNLEEVAGVPVPFSFRPVVESVVGSAKADGQSLIALQSSVLVDRYGNVEPDGTEVTLRFDGPDGRGQASAVTMAGIARLFLRAPAEPGAITIVGSSRGVPSAGPLALIFSRAIDAVPVRASRTSGTVVVRVGRILGVDGSIIADGTAVSVTITDGFGRSAASTGTLANGVVTLRLPGRSGPVSIAVTVLGLTRAVVVQ